jgi:NADH-quinone oxidoreductase subunit L
MTIPLMVLAVGAIFAGYVGIPAALGGSNHIEHFLESSFTVEGEAEAGADAEHGEEAHHLAPATEYSLMGISVLLAIGGILLARRNYVQQPEVSEQWATTWAGPHAVLTNKYYVDEAYDATFVAGTMSGARGLFAFDRGVVDGAVNGTGWTTIALSWVSHVLDKYVVDGIVNVVGGACREASYSLRRVQTGLIQNYAFATVFGLFAFVTWYLISRS